MRSVDPEANRRGIHLIEGLGRFKNRTCEYAPGAKIQVEGEVNPYLFLILNGEVELLKTGLKGGQVRVDTFKKGDLLGLTSFWTGEKSFLESRALGPVTCLRLESEDVESLAHETPEIRETLHRLFISNLSSRYRRMTALNLKVSELSESLRRERTELEAALRDLKSTKNQLILSEKLATLGQLMAGIAHEINNPCAALISSAESATTSLKKIFGHYLDPKDEELLEVGLSAPFIDSDARRERMRELGDCFPKLKRSLLRRLAALDREVFDTLILPGEGQPCIDVLEKRLECVELGTDLNTLRLSSARIGNLVASLKSYAKVDQATWEQTDIREGIQDTLTVLSNQLREYRLHVDLAPVPETLAIGGDLNQVWTNLLINACQATAPGGDIWVETRLEECQIVAVVADSGTGILESNLERIFEVNFTTKTGKTEFGLGLGLSISRDIVEKHQGVIVASNRPQGGASFRVVLPTALSGTSSP